MEEVSEKRERQKELFLLIILSVVFEPFGILIMHVGDHMIVLTCWHHPSHPT